MRQKEGKLKRGVREINEENETWKEEERRKETDEGRSEMEGDGERVKERRDRGKNGMQGGKDMDEEETEGKEVETGQIETGEDNNGHIIGPTGFFSLG